MAHLMISAKSVLKEAYSTQSLAAAPSRPAGPAAPRTEEATVSWKYSCRAGQFLGHHLSSAVLTETSNLIYLLKEKLVGR